MPGMLVYCCQDLIFATKIRSTAEALGAPSRPARDADALRNRLEQVDDGRANGPVTAVFVDLELGPVGLELIRQAKAHDDALAVVAFGSHVAAELLQQAQQHGADFVMPRSMFSSTLPALIERYADADEQAE